ncbi:aminopeptidase N-like [Sitodiplosis mosellana]|uniref:aminopeptidase N-like n=1 Tax=Sitodiplosis mosellana TaxID=263140 RepID=UPI002444A860|nr:aminopeptidase N-like [Sitodiplosis mosellana]
MARLIFATVFLFLWNFLYISADPPLEYADVGEFTFKPDNVSYRLPNNTKPEAYDILILTDIADGKFEFTGMVKITIRALEKTNTITLHQRQLKISAVQLDSEDGDRIQILPPQYDPVTEFLTITTTEKTIWPASKVILTISYKGTLREDTAGFYRSSYTNSDGKKVWLAVTQFESTDARHAFPCYDEPALKATFDIRIQHSSKYTAISNMPEIDRRETFSGSTLTQFKKIPLTSTYLIAFIISDFPYKESWSKAGFRHRVFAKPQEMDSATFGVYEGEKILDAISDYLQVNFTLPKMDQAAIPQFAAGAMENWGLVTYRETALLYNETIHSNERKISVVTTIAHEFGHQWFGNLVSPKWWSYLWLNEGFATLFQFIGTDLVHPDWSIFNDFVVQKLHVALRSDATNRTRPMTYYVENPSGIGGLFDNIAYAKSGSVLRMFMHAFNESSFKKGLNYYLNERSFNAAKDIDLFAGLERAVKEDDNLEQSLNVKDIFSSWSNQTGYPLLIVNRDYEENNIKISQERYFNKYPYPEPSSSTWWIPYNFDTANNVAVKNTFPDDWLPQGVRSAVIEPAGNKKWTKNDWVLFNKQQTGFYRVLYDQRNYKMISHELNSGDVEKIHPLSRAQILDDLNEFVLSGRLPSYVYFHLVRYLRRETEYAPWAAAMKSLFKMRRILVEGSVAYKKYIEFVANIVKPFYESNKGDKIADEPLLNSRTREMAIRLACEFGIESCLKEAEQMLEQSFVSENFTFASLNTRASIYEFGIRSANFNLTELIWSRMSSTKNSEERQEILNSFGNIANETLLREYLYRTIDSKNNLIQRERVSLFIGIATRSQYGLLQAIDLLNNEANATRKHLDLSKTLAIVAANINTNDAKNRFEPILTKLTRNSQLTEDQLELIDGKMHEAIEIFILNRKTIEDTVLELPLHVENATVHTSSGFAAIFVILINVFIMLKNL